jgi:hypothetical protein
VIWGRVRSALISAVWASDFSYAHNTWRVSVAAAGITQTCVTYATVRDRNGVLQLSAFSYYTVSLVGIWLSPNGKVTEDTASSSLFLSHHPSRCKFNLHIFTSHWHLNSLPSQDETAPVTSVFRCRSNCSVLFHFIRSSVYILSHLRVKRYVIVSDKQHYKLSDACLAWKVWLFRRDLSQLKSWKNNDHVMVTNHRKIKEVAFSDWTQESHVINYIQLYTIIYNYTQMYIDYTFEYFSAIVLASIIFKTHLI